MAKVIQIIDVDSEAYKVRLDDGSTIRMPHGGPVPHVGVEIEAVAKDGEIESEKVEPQLEVAQLVKFGPDSDPAEGTPTAEEINAAVQANLEAVKAQIESDLEQKP